MPSVPVSSASHAASGFLPPKVSGSTTFSRAVSVGTRLNAWKTNPIRSRRSSVMALSADPRA